MSSFVGGLKTLHTTLPREISSWKQHNPRLFWIAGISVIIMLVTLAGHDHIPTPRELYYNPVQTFDDNDRDAGRGPAGPAGQSSISNNSVLKYRPGNLAAAVERAEELWAHNKEKRKGFIDAHKGTKSMHEFSGAHGVQTFTVGCLRSFLPLSLGDYVCGLPRIQETRGKKCEVYSFGVEQESSWEAEILERTDCEIFMYDYSVTKFGPQLQAMDPKISSRAHFFQVGLGDKDEMKLGHQFYTLTSLMKQNGHDWIDILKVDVEGGEFTILPDMIAEFGIGRLPFSQLQLEIHSSKTAHPYNFEEFGSWWEALEESGLRAFSAELNYPAIYWDHAPMAMEMNFLNTCNGRKNCGTLLREV